MLALGVGFGVTPGRNDEGHITGGEFCNCGLGKDQPDGLELASTRTSWKAIPSWSARCAARLEPWAMVAPGQASWASTPQT